MVQARAGGLELSHDEWQGAILLVQLSRLPGQMAVRSRNTWYLTEQLAQLEGVSSLRVDSQVTQHAWHVFIIRYQAEAFGELPRDEFFRTLNAEGIPCGRGHS